MPTPPNTEPMDLSQIGQPLPRTDMASLLALVQTPLLAGLAELTSALLMQAEALQAMAASNLALAEAMMTEVEQDDDAQPKTDLAGRPIGH